MKRLIFLVIACIIFAAPDVGADPGWCDCYGGFDEDWNYWSLLDYFGYPLEDSNWVYPAWVGPDGEIDSPSTSGFPTDDDIMLRDDYMCKIEWSAFCITVTTWGEGDVDSLGNPRYPISGDLIYCRIFDGRKGEIGPGNYYADSQTHSITNYPWQGENFFCVFPGDPGGGHTDTPVPSGAVAVELMSFEAIGRDGEVLLEWRTASERDNFGFHIERDGRRVTEEIIPAVGNSETGNSYAYVDRNLTNGTTYYYNLIAVDMDGLEEMANVSPVAATPLAHVPADFALDQNYPNPFNPATEIAYTIPRDVHVILRVYNVLGAEVATLVDDDREAGFYTVGWDGEELAGGVYFCTMTAGDFRAVRKLVLLK